MAKRTKTPPSPRTPDPSVGVGPRRASKGDAHTPTLVGMPKVMSSDEYIRSAKTFLDSDDTDPGQAPHHDEPAVPASERRLTSTLLRIFARRRDQIGLGLQQLAHLTGISQDLLERFEHAKSGQTITYDQVVVLTRALGVSPDDLPGLRRPQARPHLSNTLSELEAALLAAPLLRFEGKFGERYGGDVERAAASKVFTVRIDDDSLDPAFGRGSLLGFVNEPKAEARGVALLRHRRSSILAMRRLDPKGYLGLVEWQPGYVVGGEWHVCGTLAVTVPVR